MSLRQVRHDHGLTQDQLAAELGLSGGKGSISAIETGAEVPSLELALRIAIWSAGAVDPAELRPDLADLLAAFRALPARAQVLAGACA